MVHTTPAYLLETSTLRANTRNDIIDASLDYTVYTGAGADHKFDWTLGAGVDVWSVSCVRSTPEASLTAASIVPNVFLGKNTALTRESSLLVKLDIGYNFSLNAKYRSSSTAGSNNYIVNYMFDDEIYYLGRYYLRTGLDAAYSYNLNTMLTTYAALKAGLFTPIGAKGSRGLLELSLGLMF